MVSKPGGYATAGKEWFKPWRSPYERWNADPYATELETVIRSLLGPSVSGLMRDFIVFEDDMEAPSSRRWPTTSSTLLGWRWKRRCGQEEPQGIAGWSRLAHPGAGRVYHGFYAGRIVGNRP